jgi:16S rRNA (adenine1518-N6/adenine1519-N6)-dimethyltransferase
MLQTLSTIKSLLAAHEMHPRRRFGQNFLHDGNKIQTILRAADVGPGQTVLEVGPGTGVLTEPMLEAGARVVAVEIDRDLCAILRERIGPDTDRFTLINKDVMAGKHAINPAVAAAIENGPFKLIANLPYNIASPLLATLAMDHPPMTAATIMVQREVADRLTAPSGGKEYGPLGVLVQAMCEHERITTLSPHCFWPAPQIESAVLKLTRRAQPLTDDPHRLADFLHTLFSKRRKQIGTILGRGVHLPPGITSTMRPEQLTVEQLIALAGGA